MAEVLPPRVTRSILRVVGSVAAVVVGCLVVLAGFVWHYLNAWADHLSCPDIRLGQEGQLSPGGYNNPPWCNYPRGDSITPKVGEFSILRPTWSAAAFVVIAAAAVITVALVLRGLRRWSHSSSAPSIGHGGDPGKHSDSLSSEIRA